MGGNLLDGFRRMFGGMGRNAAVQGFSNALVRWINGEGDGVYVTPEALAAMATANRPVMREMLGRLSRESMQGLGVALRTAIPNMGEEEYIDVVNCLIDAGYQAHASVILAYPDWYRAQMEEARRLLLGAS